MSGKILHSIFVFGLILQLSLGQSQEETNAETKIAVQLSVQNKICSSTFPPYNATYLIPHIDDGSSLFDVMTAANPYGFTFAYTTDPTYGAYITTVNGLEANESLHQYWALIDGWTGAFLPLGASSYKPKHGDNIVFKLSLF